MKFELPTSAQMQDDLTANVELALVSEDLEELLQLRQALLQLKTENLERLAKIREQLAHPQKRDDRWKHSAERVLRASGHLDQLIAQWLGQLRSRIKSVRVVLFSDDYLDVEEAAFILSSWILRFEGLGVSLPEDVRGAAYLIRKEAGHE